MQSFSGVLDNSKRDHRIATSAASILPAGLLLAAVPAATSAQEHHPIHGQDAVAETHDLAGEEAHHAEEAAHHGAHHHANEVGLFFGVTKEPHHAGQFTVGADYEHLFSPRWGAGAFVDFAGGELRNTLLGLSVYYHPIAKLRLNAGPALEFHKGRDDVTHDEEGHEVADEDETYFVIRVGAAYSIHLNEHWGIAPTVNVDFVEGETVWVYGAALDYGW